MEPLGLWEGSNKLGHVNCMERRWHGAGPENVSYDHYGLGGRL